MDRDIQNSRTARFKRWFRRKPKKAPSFQPTQFSDDSEDESDYFSLDGLFDVGSSTTEDQCISSHELRIFVGTWNVAGRSPVGSSAVDLDEWLNLKDAADIYVLGFQEIVPLKAKTVIGAEDPTEATNWNILIGRSLNACGYPWMTPLITPVTSENYQHAGMSTKSGRRWSFSGQSTMQHEEEEEEEEAGGEGGEEEDPSKSRYKLMASKKMVGVFISVWMKRELVQKYTVSSVKVSSVGCGVMGYLGNKGAVSVSMSIEATSFCFIAAHLASGEKRGDEGRRNHQVSEIFKRTYFPRHPQGANSNPHLLTILGHDRIFWFGDLNYRLYLEDNLARQLIKKQDWRALQKFDQLKEELDDGGVFQGWREGNIDFAPTYKYSSSNCNRYSGGLPGGAGEKQRTPAWCDRILWHGEGVKQLSYFRSESKFSDHRPVSGLFLAQIEVLKSSNASVVPTTKPPKPIGQDKRGEEPTSTLLSLIARDRQESPRHMQNCRSSK